MENVITQGLAWHLVAQEKDIPEDGGACIKINNEQIAVFNFSSRGEWYAAQNMCPHKMQMVLSRGMIGDKAGDPKVACPFHKKTYSLKTGKNLNGDDYCIKIYPIRVELGNVFVGITS